KADPRSVFAASELGVALFSSSKPAQAKEQFKRALALDPTYTDARFNLASVEASTGEWEAAAAGYKQGLAERPEYAKPQEHLGEVLIRWGDSLAKAHHDDQAIPRYREALQLRAE